jgi:hypothetical protein
LTVRRTIYAGTGLGLFVAVVVLTLLWFGVAGVLMLGGIDLMYVVWPSSLMLTVGWRTTVAGIMTTAASVALNCLMYIAVLLLLRAVMRWIGTTNS